MSSNFVGCICIMYSSKGLTFIFWFSGFFFFFFYNQIVYCNFFGFCSYIISYHFNVRYSAILFYKGFHISFYIEFSKPSGIFFCSMY